MRQCCICEPGEKSRPFEVVDGYPLRQCHGCGLVYLEGESQPEKFIEYAKSDCKADLDEDEKKTPYYGFPEMYAKYRPVFDGFFEERLSRCKRHSSELKTMFDIGAGYGFWMSFCRQKGLQTKGIDLSAEAVGYGKKELSLDVSQTPLRPEIIPRGFSLYNFCDVMEHLEDPNRELQMIHSAMDDDSLLFLQVPDVIGVRVSYRYNMCLPHHLWQFNFKTTKKLLEKNGFEVVKRWHGVLGVIGHYEKGNVTSILKLKWKMANWLNIGNRLMVLCKKAPQGRAMSH